jgi:hypothetical protein
VLAWIVKHDRAIEMRPAFRKAPRTQQRKAHEAMPHHNRNSRLLLLGERQELRRNFAHQVAVEGHYVRDPDTVEGREKQKRVFGRFAKHFSLFDQPTCTFYSRLCFRRSVSLDVEQWGYQRDLKFDFLAT